MGTVEDVSGATVRVKLGSETVSGLSFIEGHSYRVGQVGGFVRVPMGFVNLYGVISQVGASSVPERLAEVEIHGNRWMTIQLVGEGQVNPELGLIEESFSFLQSAILFIWSLRPISGRFTVGPTTIALCKSGSLRAQAAFQLS
ncbi:hypothetical protein [Bradyrhizobium brasilense]|uniref:hypothetical protein n=1 Tax=Bradyrhizobium brasilense TaxID=1419277 RepID=UPI001F2C2AD0|nr:hypothetical protein [Bradyrhizobium brasilense]